MAVITPTIPATAFAAPIIGTGYERPETTSMTILASTMTYHKKISTRHHDKSSKISMARQSLELGKKNLRQWVKQVSSQQHQQYQQYHEISSFQHQLQTLELYKRPKMRVHTRQRVVQQSWKMSLNDFNHLFSFIYNFLCVCMVTQSAKVINITQ